MNSGEKLEKSEGKRLWKYVDRRGVTQEWFKVLVMYKNRRNSKLPTVNLHVSGNEERTWKEWWSKERKKIKNEEMTDPRKGIQRDKKETKERMQTTQKPKKISEIQLPPHHASQQTPPPTIDLVSQRIRRPRHPTDHGDRGKACRTRLTHPYWHTPSLLVWQTLASLFSTFFVVSPAVDNFRTQRIWKSPVVCWG